MRFKKQIITLLALFFIVSIALSAYAAPGDYNLSLEATTDANGVNVATSFNQGDVVYLNILLDNPANVAGVAFTLTYDNTQVTGPTSGPEGLPENAGDVVSHFPFMSAATETHRFNSTETNKIYLAGAEIDPATGGFKWAAGPITLFTIKFTAKIDAVLGIHTFVLEQTELFNLDAGYGTDIIVNGTYDEGTDTKDQVAVLVGAIPSSDPNWGGDLSDDFPDLTPDLGALPSLPITIDRLGPKLDIDGNDVVEAGADGLLILRYLIGFTEETLINNAVGSGATRTTAAEIQAYLVDGVSSLVLDVDGNGLVEAGADGLLILRYLIGFTGDTLINNAVGSGATRTTAAEIQAYIQNNI